VDDENDNLDVAHSGESSTSILGSLEKLVESSFTDMKNVGKKKNGNGILQRLGIDDDHPPTFQTLASAAKSTSGVFDFYRSTQNFKRFSRNDGSDISVKADKDEADSEMSDVESLTPNSVVGNSNPLLALKELCNNTTSTMSTVTSQKRQKTLRSDESLLSSASSTPKMLIENGQNDVENNVVLNRVIEPECPTQEDEEMEKNVANKIRVKNDSELLKTSRHRRSRRHEASQSDDKKATSEETASQATTEAKYFRYSELAKVLSAGN